VTPDELRTLAKLAGIGLVEVERRDGVRDWVLRDLVRRVELEARVSASPSMVASVTAIAEAPSRRVWRRCVECGRSVDVKLRRGRCGACYQRWRRGHSGGHTVRMGA
jgi:hypothetical protein